MVFNTQEILNIIVMLLRFPITMRRELMLQFCNWFGDFVTVIAGKYRYTEEHASAKRGSAFKAGIQKALVSRPFQNLST